MKIQNQFRIPVTADTAWAVLNDVPRVARCAPGAELLEERSDGSYLGTVAVRLGPVSLSFKGTFTYRERDEANRRVVAHATGSEQRARGTARADVIVQLTPEGDSTLVNVETDVQLAGAVAQYGRGRALIESTAQVLLDQFAKNLAAELGAGGPESSPKAGAEEPGHVAPTALTHVQDADQASDTAAAAPPRKMGTDRTGTAVTEPSVGREISGLALLVKGARHAFVRWLRGLFGRAS